MEGVSLVIAIVLGLVALGAPLVYALLGYVASLAWYPGYLTLPIGTIDLTVQRIVVFALLCRVLLTPSRGPRFRFEKLDWLVLLFLGLQLSAGLLTATSSGLFIEKLGGGAFDSILPYFAVRLIIRDRQQYLLFLKGAILIAVPVACLACFQCLTGVNPVGFLKNYYAWAAVGGVRVTDTPWQRSGFFRADVVFSHPIVLGLFLSTIGVTAAGLLGTVRGQRSKYIVGLSVVALGVVSSMSSGPFLMLAIAVPVILAYRHRPALKRFVVFAIVMCVAVDIASNRSFYDVLGDLTMDPHSAWYRSRLISVALWEGGMDGHWLLGYGHGEDLGWGPKIDGRAHTDVLNHFICVLALYGLVGLIPFIWGHVTAFACLVRSFKGAVFDADRWIVWCLGAALAGLTGAMMSVSLFDAALPAYYMLIALAAAMPKFVRLSGAQTRQGQGQGASARRTVSADRVMYETGSSYPVVNARSVHVGYWVL